MFLKLDQIFRSTFFKANLFLVIFVVLGIFALQKVQNSYADSGCPCTFFGTAVPATPANLTDNDPVNLGLSFKTTVDGQITGVRFYKADTNTGTHIGYLWNSDGTLIDQVTFTGETSSGWQEATFNTPISVTANTVYVVSYSAPVGNYAIERHTFGSGLTVGPLYAFADGESGNKNGVYGYGPAGTFPNNSFDETNYFVDVIFTDSPGASPSPSPTPSPTPDVTSVQYTITADDRDAVAEKLDSTHYDVRLSGFDPDAEPYDFASTDSDDESSGMQFPISVPAGATITNAYMTVKAAPQQNTSATGGMYIYLNDLDDVPAFTSQVISGKMDTLYPIYPSPILWSAGTSWSTGSSKQTSNLASFVQTFIDRSGYEEGNYIGFVVTGGTLPNGRYYGWNDYHAGSPTTLTVEYTTPTPSPSPSPSPTPTPTPSPSPSPSPTASATTSPSSQTSEPAAPTCTDQKPGDTAPQIYAAVPQGNNSLLIYFSSAGDPVSKYVLEYGTSTGNYPYGSQNIGGHDTRTYLIQSLAPNTTYYFRVHATNGCADGPWSNELSGKTGSVLQTNTLKTTALSLDTIPANDKAEQPASNAPTQTASQSASYVLDVKVTDKNKQAVKGAKVTLHSKVQEALTDESGIAHFKNVEAGEHHVNIAYNGYEGAQTVTVSGDVKQLQLTVTVEPQSVWSNRPLWIATGISLLIILCLLSIILRLRKNRNA